MTDKGGVQGPGQSGRRKSLRRRFYRSAEAARDAGAGGGFRVLLDGRAIKTPMGAVFAAPSRALAEAMAAEWESQHEVISSETMRLTRLAYGAIDRVRGCEAEVVADITKFAASDLLCYRADWPQALADVQAEAWDPVLAWVEERFDAPFLIGQGITPIVQPGGSIAKVKQAFAAYDAFALAAAHAMTALMGSALLALALAHDRLLLEEAWAAAHVDETWQASRWGRDAEAEARLSRRLEDMTAAARFLALSQRGNSGEGRA
jgi:chaperone required for assembly of F1-ATPase